MFVQVRDSLQRGQVGINSPRYMAVPSGASGLPVTPGHVENPLTIDEELNLLHTAAKLRATSPFMDHLNEIATRFSERFPQPVRTHRQLQSHLVGLVQSQKPAYVLQALQVEENLPPEKRMSWPDMRSKLHTRSNLIYFLNSLQRPDASGDSHISDHPVHTLPPTNSVVPIPSESDPDPDANAIHIPNTTYNSNSKKKRPKRASLKHAKRCHGADDDQDYCDALEISLTTSKQTSNHTNQHKSAKLTNNTVSRPASNKRAIHRDKNSDQEVVIIISEDELEQKAQSPVPAPQSTPRARNAARHFWRNRTPHTVVTATNRRISALNKPDIPKRETDPELSDLLNDVDPSIPGIDPVFPELNFLDSALSDHTSPNYLVQNLTTFDEPMHPLPETPSPTTAALNKMALSEIMEAAQPEPEMGSGTGTLSNSSLKLATLQTTGQPSESKPVSSSGREDLGDSDGKQEKGFASSSPGSENNREQHFDCFMNEVLMNAGLDDTQALSPSPVVNSALMPKSMALSDERLGEGRLQGLLDDLDQESESDDKSS